MPRKLRQVIIRDDLDNLPASQRLLDASEIETSWRGYFRWMTNSPQRLLNALEIETDLGDTAVSGFEVSQRLLNALEIETMRYGEIATCPLLVAKAAQCLGN